ncbi:glycosyltransferase family 2 protein [Bradyrhizobium glycinis]|uniref:glycosyltransferase family 2 protein n=1 Tax=Bradyrhizobium glycinis TaxID=2751812 RepID=UPI0024BFB236|nr:glycosyltransferase family A protein [Bradyrhizobium glycinis]
MDWRGKPAAVVEPPLRPRWSVMIPAYNVADDLRRSLSSVLEHGWSVDVMQIQVVDDASTTDDAARIAEELGQGRVEFFRQPVNVGHARNFNTCVERARGHFVHILHSDDWVKRGFYDEMDTLFRAFPGAGAAFCRHAIVSSGGNIQRVSAVEKTAPGIIERWFERIGAELPLQPPSMVVHRAVYEDLGSFDTRMASCAEDWEMWARIAAFYPVAFTPQILAYYQDTEGSITKRSISSGQNMKDVRRAINILGGYVDTSVGRSVLARAPENWAKWGIYWSYTLICRGEFKSALVQLWQSLLCSQSRRTLAAVLNMALFFLKRRLRVLVRS